MKLNTAFLLLSTTITASLFISPAYGWGKVGHEITGAIATRFLRDRTKKAVMALLPPTEASLSTSTTWADRIRPVKGYSWAAKLHYINPADNPPYECSFDMARDCKDGNCIVSAITNYTSQLTKLARQNTRAGQGDRFPISNGFMDVENKNTNERVVDIDDSIYDHLHDHDYYEHEDEPVSAKMDVDEEPENNDDDDASKTRPKPKPGKPGKKPTKPTPSRPGKKPSKPGNKPNRPSTPTSVYLSPAQEALLFLVHFIGDIHQPLHVCGRLRGGNSYKINWRGSSGTKSLHQIWDTDMVVKRIHDKYQASADTYVNYLVDRLNTEFVGERNAWLQCEKPIPVVSGSGTRSGMTRTNSKTAFVCPDEWAGPLNDLNCEAVWKGLSDSVETKDLSGDYYEQNMEFVERTLMLAGYRIAHFLNSIL